MHRNRADQLYEHEKQEKIKLEEHSKILKSLAGSIVHEIRNPLNIIRTIGAQLDRLANSGKRSGEPIPQDIKEHLSGLTHEISETVEDANNIPLPNNS